MPYQIEVEHNLGVIRLLYSGEVTLEQRISVVNVLCIEYKLFDRFRFLIDVRAVTNTLKANEQELLGKYFASRPEFVRAKIAVLTVPEQPINRTLLAQAAESGLQNQIFNSESDAIAWLIE